MSEVKTKTKVEALTTWVILDDPRERKEEASKIFVGEELEEELKQEELQAKVLQTVVSCGPNVQDRDKMPPGTKVVVDPRLPGDLVEVNEETGEVCAYVQENQILMIVK